MCSPAGRSVYDTSTMIYHDSIYGVVELHEPILVDLLQTTAMCRLQGVMQHGVSALVGITQPVTRFEHSVGVMLLVRRLGAALAEQIAALLHDVSHTAFSHVIDYVFQAHTTQSYHEERKEWYLGQTDVPAVLARHGYDWQAFLHEEAYPLLEQPAPALCADRLDYFLRDSLDLGLSSPERIQAVLDHLVVQAGRIGVDDLAVARWLGYTYIATDQASWANLREVGLYELTARAIRRGLQTGELSEADIWGTDEPLWQKLHASTDPELRALLILISADTEFVLDEACSTFKVGTKLRTIDPDVSMGGGLQPLSTLDPEFGQYRAEYLSRKQGEWPIRVIGSSGMTQ